MIGGAEIYAAALPRVDELVLTEVELDVAGDTFLPAGARDGFEEVARDRRVSADGTPFALVTYRRQPAA